ncbi:hypothetical protein ACIBCT_10870 [Streptosporangium sp. NPDC050855]|uniref:hypothetical protein n=1 Tax=Streptosporangium sp. NPDC050855 TaxID=3366194 RepID=UPI003791E828
MDVREPDWAYVSRSLVKVLAVSAALFMALHMAEGLLRVFVDFGEERAARVRATAARIANPERRLDTWPNGSRVTEGINSLDWISDIDAKSVDEAQTVAEQDREIAERNRKTKEEARKIIRKLPQTLDALAVVDFTHAMTTEQLIAFNRRHELCGGADISYVYSLGYYDDSSDDPETSEVVWNRDLSEEHTVIPPQYQCETEPQIALAAFRRWVGLLDENDDLSEFDLYDWWLAGVAEQGVVYGLVVDRWKLPDLLPLLDDPKVRTITLADVAFDLGEIR